MNAHLIDTLYAEAAKAGVTVTITEGGVSDCRAYPDDRQVYIGQRVGDALDIAIVGMHELGHVVTHNLVLLYLPPGRLLWHEREVAAWNWAERFIIGEDGERDRFDRWRNEALDTYRVLLESPRGMTDGFIIVDLGQKEPVSWGAV